MRTQKGQAKDTEDSSNRDKSYAAGLQIPNPTEHRYCPKNTLLKMLIVV